MLKTSWGGGHTPIHYSSFVPGHKLVEAEMCLATEHQKQRNFHFKSLTKEKNQNIVYETINMHKGVTIHYILSNPSNHDFILQPFLVQFSFE